MSVSFVKLFTTLTDSSVWALPDNVRVIWITMLSMVNARGNVRASVLGVANRARKSVEEVEEALRVFMSPDPYSRTKIDEGRRLVEIDGGWHFITWDVHRRALDAEAARERKRKWWTENRSAATDLDQLDKPRPDSTRANLDGAGLGESSSVGVMAANPAGKTPLDGELDELDKTRKHGSISYSYSGSEDLDPDPDPTRAHDRHETTPGAIAFDPNRGRIAPADFTPTDTHRVRCQECKLDSEVLLREFKLFEFNRDYSDWNRRFSRWIEDAKIKAETARADALSRAAKGPRSSFGGGRDQRGHLVVEASEKHRRFAKKHDVDLDAILAHLHRTRAAENLGVGRATEMIGELLSQQARAKAQAAS